MSLIEPIAKLPVELYFDSDTMLSHRHWLSLRKFDIRHFIILLPVYTVYDCRTSAYVEARFSKFTF